MPSFRDHLFPSGHPRFAGLDELDAAGYADAMRAHPIAGELIEGWISLFDETDFRGITTDGNLIHGLFDDGGEEHSPSSSAFTAVRDFLDSLTAEQRTNVIHPLDSRVWRAWMNPEFYLNRFGLRLDELPAEQVRTVHELMRASLSPAGYNRARDIMRTNDFLGSLVALPALLNENSYNVNIFGTPSDGGTWGWSLYGHHLCVNCLFVEGRQILAPVFFGAEPSEIDDGPHKGTVLFTEQQAAALNFARRLPPSLRSRAVLFDNKRDPDIPEGRIHLGDELHLGGAFQDNRVIPYEGLPIVDCPPEIQQHLMELVATFLDYQPSGPRAARLTQVQDHLPETWFCWIGGTGESDVFYFRVQSPVIMVEFDHHAGVFLANDHPERFHIHTLVRHPNGNDYGVSLLEKILGRRVLLDGED